MKQYCAVLGVLVSCSLAQAGFGGTVEYGKPFKIGGSADGCTQKSDAQIEAKCRTGIKRFATEACIEAGLNPVAREIADTFSIYIGHGGDCDYSPGIYVAYSCEAYFECVRRAGGDLVDDSSND